jgi:RNA ligase
VKVDLTKLEEQVALGNVNYQVHPQLPLKIYKYSKQAVYTQAWNDITLLCRGLVLDVDGNVVVNCMPKFYNNNQGEALPVFERTKGLSYEVFDKMDGSLLQIVNWNGQRIITSSGSFDSPQVHKAAEMLKKQYPHYVFKDGITYIFEIIYPENRIVLNYGDKECLTLLAMRETETGKDISYTEMSHMLLDGWDIVQQVNKTVEEVLAELPQNDFINKEGYVVKFSNGDRLKFKFDKYCQLHKVISGISEKWVHANLRDGLDYRQSAVEIPDELNDWILETMAKYKQMFHAKMVETDAIWRETTAFSSVRKEQAQYLLSKHRESAKLVFGLLDGRDISKQIWDLLEPSGEQQMKWGAGASADEE